MIEEVARTQLLCKEEAEEREENGRTEQMEMRGKGRVANIKLYLLKTAQVFISFWGGLLRWSEVPAVSFVTHEMH